MNIVQTKSLLTTKYVNLYETQYKDKTGRDRNWLWVGRPAGTKAVMIVPIIEGEYVFNAGYKQLNRICVIKEYRIPLADYVWDFPAGLIDVNNETVEDCVKRELKEETGLTVDTIYKITPFIYNSPGITDESIAIAYVKASGELSKDHLESAEEIESFLFRQDEVEELLKKETNFAAKAYVTMEYFAKTNHIIGY